MLLGLEEFAGRAGWHLLLFLLYDACREFKDFFKIFFFFPLLSPAPPRPQLGFFPLDVEVSSAQELSVEKYK